MIDHEILYHNNMVIIVMIKESMLRAEEVKVTDRLKINRLLSWDTLVPEHLGARGTDG